jgi:Mg-chelatase subunit ChlD
MIFILDVSGSMNIPFAKRNLRNAYRTLGAREKFAIVCYDHRIFYWPESKRLVPASTHNKQAADDWIDALVGGQMTDIHGALEKGFEISKNGDGADTFYLLSDGRPTAGIRQAALILKAVRKWNGREQVKIHALGLGDDHDEELMRNLALENRGNYRYIRFK